MNKIVNPTFGSDPEFAFINKITGKAVSACNKLGGSKKQPIDIGEGCGKQEDGVMGEGTIPPVKTREEFIQKIMYCKNTFDAIMKQQDPNIECVSISSAFYDESELQDPKVLEFGCDPSFSHWLKNVSPRPTAAEVGNLRSAGFHIHVGTETELTIEEIEKFMLCMDITCGLPSVLIDQDMNRKKLYGNPGDFRFKQLINLTIVEYRTLGGNCHDGEELIGYFFDQTNAAIELFNNYEKNVDLIDQYYKNIEKAISTNNEQLAISIMKAFNVQIPQYEKMGVANQLQ